MPIKAFKLIPLIVLVGCASLSKEQCEEQDWQKYATTRTKSHPGNFKSIANAAIKACEEHQVKPNIEALKLGYVDGINEYCQSKNIWDLGLAGKSINILYCPAGNRAKLQRVYNASKELNEIEVLEQQIIDKQNQITRFQNEVYSIENELASAYARNAIASEIGMIQSRLSTQRHQIIQTQNEIMILQLKVGQLKRRARTFEQVI